MIPLCLPYEREPSCAEISFWLHCYFKRKRPVVMLDLDTPIAALGLDSFERVELAIALEDRYDLVDDGSVEFEFDTIRRLSASVLDLIRVSQRLGRGLLGTAVFPTPG